MPADAAPPLSCPVEPWRSLALGSTARPARWTTKLVEGRQRRRSQKSVSRVSRVSLPVWARPVESLLLSSGGRRAPEQPCEGCGRSQTWCRVSNRCSAFKGCQVLPWWSWDSRAPLHLYFSLPLLCGCGGAKASHVACVLMLPSERPAPPSLHCHCHCRNAHPPKADNSAGCRPAQTTPGQARPCFRTAGAPLLHTGEGWGRPRERSPISISAGHAPS